VAAICGRLEGLPLAIELAAARVRILPPDRLLERLTSRLSLLTGGAADRDPRQQTLRGAIAWSHDLLPPAERALFRRLAAFAGGTFEAIEAVCAADGAADPLEGLDALVRQSLLRQEEQAHGPRFFMLESIREFAAEQLAASGEESAIRTAHGEHFLGFAEAAEPQLTGPDQVEWLDRLEADHDNFRTALTRLAQTSPAQELRLVAALWRFWDARGHLSEGRGYLEAALSHDRGGGSAVRATALDGLGVITWVLGDAQRAAAFHEEALALSQASADEPAAARSLGYLGWIASSLGDLDRAVPYFEQALAVFRRTGDERRSAVMLNALGDVALNRGRFDEAEVLANEAYDVYRQLNDPVGSAESVQLLGRIAWHAGDFAVAADRYEESLGHWRQLGFSEGIALDCVNSGRAAQRLGDPERAISRIEEGLQIARDLGDSGTEAFALNSLGHLMLEIGDHKRAHALIVQSFELNEQIGEKIGMAECLLFLASVASSRGDALASVLLLAAAERLRKSIGTQLGEDQRAEYAGMLEFGRDALDSAAFEEAWMMGSVMSPSQAIAEYKPSTP
jgi:tetratricopeptide (TPR) repeat protein